MKLIIYLSIGIVREARTNPAIFLDTRRKLLSSSDAYLTIVEWLPSSGTRISPATAKVAEYSGTTIYTVNQMENWIGIFTPTNPIPVLSENDANCSACEWSAKASLISLMVWLPGNKSLTNCLSEKLTSSNAFNIFARSAPRWGVPRNAIPIVFFLIWVYLELLCAAINAWIDLVFHYFCWGYLLYDKTAHTMSDKEGFRLEILAKTHDVGWRTSPWSS